MQQFKQRAIGCLQLDRQQLRGVQQVAHRFGGMLHLDHARPMVGQRHVHRQARKDLVDEIRRYFGRAQGGAGRADAAALSGLGDNEVVAAVGATGAGKAVGEGAAVEVTAEFAFGERRVRSALARRLALDPAGLGELRGRFEHNRHAAALFNVVTCTRSREAMYGRMWARHLTGVSPEAINMGDDPALIWRLCAGPGPALSALVALGAAFIHPVLQLPPPQLQQPGGGGEVSLRPLQSGGDHQPLRFLQ